MDEVKWIGYKALKEDMTEIEGWCSGLKAKNMKEARKGNRLERYMARIIYGVTKAEELHSTRQAEGERRWKQCLQQVMKLKGTASGILGEKERSMNRSTLAETIRD